MDIKSYETVRDLALALGDFLAQSARQAEEIEKLTKERDESKALILSFLAGLTLCDHMGDVGNEMQDVLKRIGLGDIHWDDEGELGTALAKMGVKTLNGTDLTPDEE